MINLFWYKMPNGKKNFGDELGPYIIKKLTDSPICYIPIVNSWYKVIPLYILGCIKGKYTLSNFRDILNSLFAKNVLISVGSIISSYNKKNVTVWGAGLLKETDVINNANFLAVRGIYTQEKIRQLGYYVPNVLGDPAILTPLILSPAQKKFELGIIPHYIHYPEIKERIKDDRIFVINLLDDIETIIQNLSSCKKTISSSLHGLIISHSYGIESLWYNLGEKKLAGDNIKFRDYFSSVKIEEYVGFDIELNSLDLNIIYANFKTNIKIALPNKNTSDIQHELLKVFPYKLKEKYLHYVQ